MNAPFSRLHADLTDLADEVRVVDLRDRAVRTSRRLAMRRTLVGAAAAVGVIAIGAGTAFAVLPGRHAALPAGAGPSDQATAAPAQVTPSASAPTAEAPSAGPSTASPEPSTSGSGVPAAARCHTDELRVTVENSPGGGAAGSVYYWLVFTNTSARTCTLYGFPGVSYVTGSDGQQVNDPARRSAASTSTLVSLDPGHAAYAQLQTGHPEMFPDTCKPVTVAGYRVYPPDETAAIFVPAPSQECSTSGVNVMSVYPMAPLPGR
jgi:hypothetical protein